MGKRRRVPEDLMESILSEGSGTSSEVPTTSGSSDRHWTVERNADRVADREAGSRPRTGEDSLRWEEHPERVGITFNLSKQLGARLEALRQELQPEEGGRLSRSELVEVALRLAVEDAREKGRESELARKLSERSVYPIAGIDGEAVNSTIEATDEAGETVRRSVSEAGWIIETLYDENGQVLDEDVVANVADLPVETEYINEAGRLVSLARDEFGNTFEQILDEHLNPLEARLLPDVK